MAIIFVKNLKNRTIILSVITYNRLRLKSSRTFFIKRKTDKLLLSLEFVDTNS